MRTALAVVTAWGLGWASGPVQGAGAVFAAKGKKIEVIEQKIMLTWDPNKKVQHLTIQATFRGDAPDFAIVMATPSQPKLHEMPRDFFKALQMFTQLGEMDEGKHRGKPEAQPDPLPPPKPNDGKIVIIEFGLGETLDYKIIGPGKGDVLFAWLKDHRYDFEAGKEALEHYLKKDWHVTVMRLDTQQWKRRADDTFEREVSSFARYTFVTEKPVLPLKLWKPSAPERLPTRLYLLAPVKCDLAGDLSFQADWLSRWRRATKLAVPEKLTDEDRDWLKHSETARKSVQEHANRLAKEKRTLTALEWARRLTSEDDDLLRGKKALPMDRQMIRQLAGHLPGGEFLLKVRKDFLRSELETDLEIVPAWLGDRKDELEYGRLLPKAEK